MLIENGHPETYKPRRGGTKSPVKCHEKQYSAQANIVSPKHLFYIWQDGYKCALLRTVIGIFNYILLQEIQVCINL